MTLASTASVIDDLRQYHLLDAMQLEEFKSFQARCSDPKALAKELIQRGWLTPYQANQLLQGRAKNSCWVPMFCGSVWAKAAWDRSSRPATGSWAASSPSSLSAKSD